MTDENFTPPENDTATSLRASLGLFALGLVLAAFLTAIGRPGWFELRPVSSAASAMSAASSQAEQG